MSETINNGSTSGTGNSLESISIDIPLSDVYQLEPQLLLKNRVESFTFLLIFLLFLLKTLYIYFIDNRLLKSRKPKKIVYSLVLLLLLLFVLFNFIWTFNPQQFTYFVYLQIKIIIGTFTEILAISSCILVYLYWISILENDFKITQKQKGYSFYSKVLFFSFFSLFYIITCIFSILTFFKKYFFERDDLITKIRVYYLLSTNFVVVITLWAFLIYKYKTLDKTVTNRIKNFFIVASVFSLNELSFVILNCVVNFSNQAGYYWIYIFNLIAIYLQLIFFINPIDFNLILSKLSRHQNNNNTEPEIKEQQNEIDLEENQFSVKNIEIEQETQIIEQQNEFDRSKSLSDQQP